MVYNISVWKGKLIVAIDKLRSTDSSVVNVVGGIFVGILKNDFEYENVSFQDKDEHAYYFDYKNDKKEFANNFWQIVNWPIVEERYRKLNTLIG
jgi:hypothetical protein